MEDLEIPNDWPKPGTSWTPPLKAKNILPFSQACRRNVKPPAKPARNISESKGAGGEKAAPKRKAKAAKAKKPASKAKAKAAPKN